MPEPALATGQVERGRIFAPRKEFRMVASRRSRKVKNELHTETIRRTVSASESFPSRP
jgi:hypothetical protein